ncbi:hypothetical protein MOO46_06020 [Apilactobacillus apisilvae]|uniref:Uncharacterized protein n=1 Tax=Apilactobacillus apisilvae TaxID=2923364 RepID=A0ABY4PG85_9LACO|nr:hypothetical protein [Apilactobacillus apisilvae]UQS84800.1 hypothetical protein MOO46_06020 [Apilactobacillus apisilvae]
MNKNLQLIKHAEELGLQDKFAKALEELKQLPEISVEEYTSKIKVSKKPSKDSKIDVAETRKLNDKLSTFDYLNYHDLLDSLIVNIASVIDDDKCDLDNNVINNLDEKDLANANNVINEFLYDTDIEFKTLKENTININMLEDNIINKSEIMNNVYSFDAFDIHNVSKKELQAKMQQMWIMYKKIQ